MANIKTMGQLLLSGFDLEPAEKAIVDNIIRNYDHKISLKCTYDYLQLKLKKSRRGKAFLHQVNGSLKTSNRIFSSEASEYNLFAALAEVMEKLLHEIEHKVHKNKTK
ncbi:MAG: hypothetical protein ABIH72_01390 [archaeon]